MALVWQENWFEFTQKEHLVLENIGEKWKNKEYENLGIEDYVRLEPFLEPFDAVYSEQEIAIMNRVGQNGVQDQYCSMFIQSKSGSTDKSIDNSTNDSVWVLEWYLVPTDVKRQYLKKVSNSLFGKQLQYDETECMIMLTHSLSCLRRLEVSEYNGKLVGKFRVQPTPVVHDSSIDDPQIKSSSI